MVYTKKDDNLSRTAANSDLSREQYRNNYDNTKQALAPSVALANEAAENMIQQSGKGAVSARTASSGISGGSNYGVKAENTAQNAYSAWQNMGAYTPSAQANSMQSAAEQAAYDLINKGPYAESQSVVDARDRYNTLINNRPNDYVSKYDSEINATIETILNRGDFSYNYEDDPLYRQYEESYTAGADKAMNNALSAASARTGGYGNSYAAGASNAAYQQYMSALADKIPELRQQAYNEWLNSGNEKYKQYELLANRDNADYVRYRDTVADWNTDRSFAADDYRDERNYDYSKYNAEIANAQNTASLAQGVADSMSQKELNAYNSNINNYQNLYSAAEDANRRQKEFDYQQTRDNVSDEQFNRTLAYQQAKDAADMDWAQEQFNRTFDYQQNRDAVGDNQFDRTFAYQQDRDKVSDEQFNRTLAYQQAMDAAEMDWAKEQYWNDFNNISAYQQAALNKSSSSSSNSKSIR